jgi:uncharacterized membrane protein
MKYITQICQPLIGDSSFVLAVIYTIGHILIAIVCVRLITGASLDLAAADAFVEPIINGFWFYFLHKVWGLRNER